MAAAPAPEERNLPTNCLVLEGERLVSYAEYLEKENQQLKIKAQKSIKKKAVRPKGEKKDPTAAQKRLRDKFGSIAHEAREVYKANGAKDGPMTWRETVNYVSMKRKAETHNAAQTRDLKDEAAEALSEEHRAIE